MSLPVSQSQKNNKYHCDPEYKKMCFQKTHESQNRTKKNTLIMIHQIIIENNNHNDLNHLRCEILNMPYMKINKVIKKTALNAYFIPIQKQNMNLEEISEHYQKLLEKYTVSSDKKFAKPQNLLEMDLPVLPFDWEEEIKRRLSVIDNEMREIKYLMEKYGNEEE
jgi:hypothetical protein